MVAQKRITGVLIAITTIISFFWAIVPHAAFAAVKLSMPPSYLGLVAYYPLDGNTINWSTGQVADLSGNGNNGTLVSIPATSAVPGKIGQGLHGTTFVIQFPSLASLIGATSTFSVWVNKTNSHDGYLETEGSDSNGNSEDFYDGGGVLFDHLTNGVGGVTAYNFNDTGGDADGTWHLMTRVTTPSSTIIYVDGVPDISNGAGPYVWTWPDTTFDVGTDDGGGNPTSSFDDIRIYNRALSQSEITKLYNAGKAVIGYSPTIVPSGLVGYWPFDSNATDASGNGNNGSYTCTGSPSFVTGKIKQALLFPSGWVDNQCVSLSSDWTLTNNDSTVSAWIKISSSDTTDDNTELLATTYSGNSGDKINIDYNIKYSFVDCQIGSTHYEVDLSANYFDDLAWHQIACTRNATTGTYIIYVDGVQEQVDNGGQTGAIDLESSGNNGLTIGSTAGVAVDDVRMYNRALSQGDITTLYNAKSGSQTIINHSNTLITNGLVGYWTFDGADVDGTNAYDRSGQGNNGTLSGSLTPTIGKIGQAIFIGSDDALVDVHAPDGYDSPSFMSTGSPLTVSFWIKTTSTSYGGLVCGDRYGNWCVELDGGFTGQQIGSIRFENGNGGSNTATSVAGINNGQWHLVTIANNGTNTTFYIDGAFDSTYAQGAVGTGNSDLNFGNSVGGGVRLFSSTTSASTTAPFRRAKFLSSIIWVNNTTKSPCG